MPFKPTPEQLKEILTQHKLWLDKKPGGKRADLRGANLRNANLRNANLRYADLWNADLWNAKLHQLSGPAYEIEGEQKYVVWGVKIG